MDHIASGLSCESPSPSRNVFHAGVPQHTRWTACNRLASRRVARWCNICWQHHW